MGLGSRTARRHDTNAQRKLGGVDAKAYWDHSPGDRVLTCDGYPGVVTGILDGFHPGNESYEVRLDGGMGGGLYSSGQLRATQGQAEANVVHTAADDYPVLADILRDRPDPALDQVMARRQAAEYSPEIEQAELDNPGVSQRDPELDPDEVEADFQPPQHTGSNDSYALLAEAMASGASDAELDGLIAGLRTVAYAGSPWGDPVPDKVHYSPGPTAPRVDGENPASAGPLSGGDPDGWRHGPLNTRVTPLSWTATLHESPEPALPSTDGADEDEDHHEAMLRQANPALLALAPELLGAGEAGAAGAAGRGGAGADLLGNLPGLMGGGESHGGGADQDAGSKPDQTGEEAIRDPSVTSRAGLNLEGDEDPTDGVMSDMVPKAASTDDLVAHFQATAVGRSLGAVVQKQALKDFTADERRALIDEGQGTRAGNLGRLDVTGTHYADIPEDEEQTWLA